MNIKTSQHVVNACQDQLLNTKGVVGVALGIHNNALCVNVCVKHTDCVYYLPQKIEGIPVRVNSILSSPELLNSVKGPTFFRLKHRPVIPGSSIGGDRKSAGSAGFRLFYNKSTYLLTNSHVFSLLHTKKSLICVQPAIVDTRTKNVIGYVSRWIPFRPPSVIADALIVRLVETQMDNVIHTNQNTFKRINSTVEPYIGQRVMKVGRTTGFSGNGVVTAINSCVSVTSDTGFIRIRNLFEIQNVKTAPGDSGGAVVDQKTGKAVGLATAKTVLQNGQKITYCTTVSSAIRFLGITGASVLRRD